MCVTSTPWVRRFRDPKIPRQVPNQIPYPISGCNIIGLVVEKKVLELGILESPMSLTGYVHLIIEIQGVLRINYRLFLAFVQFLIFLPQTFRD